MAVLWVVIRGWGVPAAATTGGILLYGIFDQLSRFGLMFVAGSFLIVAEAVEPRRVGGDRRDRRVPGASAACCSSGIGGGLILVVRSERLARKIGRIAERVIGAVLRRFGRPVPDVG